MCTRGIPQIKKGKKDDFSFTDINDNAFLDNSNSSENLQNYSTCKQNKDPYVILSNLRNKISGKLIIGHLNINSHQNKFEALKFLIQGKVESFPRSQFAIEGVSSPFRLDRNGDDGGIIIYIRSDIPCKEMKKYLPNNIEGIFIELNLRKKKWILFGGYNPKKECMPIFLN